MTVHFICRGNAHRSLIAEAYLKSLHLKDVNVLSSGTVADTYRSENEPRIPNIINRLDKHGTSVYFKTHSDQLTQVRVDNGDVTVCMNQVVADECNNLASMPENTLVWDITDSGEGNRIVQPGEDEYKYLEEIYKEITRNVDELVQEIDLA